MATYQTYQSVGNREDLTDIIENISPMDTWFTANTGSTTARSTYHEWQTDELQAPGANALVEGAATVDGTIQPTTRLGNYTQILGKAFKVAKTEEAIDKAGRASEIAYQTEKHMKELARDIEYALLFNSAQNSGASGTARQLGGALYFIQTNVETGTGTGNEALTEDMLNDALQTVWAAGGMVDGATLLAGAFQKRAISNFTTNTRFMVADENKLASAVDIYQSDFGTVKVRLHHQVNSVTPEKVFIFGDMGHWQKAWLRPVKRQQEPFAGDADLFSIRGELTLVCKQEKGHGLIDELTTA